MTQLDIKILTRMANILDSFFRVTTVLAGICFVAVATLVLYQLGGQVWAYVPRSADEFAGYCMGASAFLGLADALHSGDHIRVTLVADRLPADARRAMEWIAIAIGLMMSAWMAWYIVRMAWFSWSQNELSSGLIALPMWIPQGAMAWGAVAFFVAMLELAGKMLGGATIPSGGDAKEFSADR